MATQQRAGKPSGRPFGRPEQSAPIPNPKFTDSKPEVEQRDTSGNRAPSPIRNPKGSQEAQESRKRFTIRCRGFGELAFAVMFMPLFPLWSPVQVNYYGLVLASGRLRDWLLAERPWRANCVREDSTFLSLDNAGSMVERALR